METFIQEENEKCKTKKGLFSVLSNRIKPQHNFIMLAPQYQKLHGKCNESAREWMDRPPTKVAECEYRDPDRLLMEQFIGMLNDYSLTEEILREVTDIKETTSEHVLGWTHGVEAYRAKGSMQNNIKEAKDSDAIWENSHKWVNGAQSGHKCMYCGTGHPPC